MPGGAGAEGLPGIARSAGPVSAPLAEALRRADREELHDDPRWRALLHYERTRLPPGDRSPVLTRAFFLDPLGDRDPRAELQATLRAFFDRDAAAPGRQHPQCAFLARQHWIAQHLELPAVECPEYARWRAGLQARGLTLVFPTGFMNDPASIFGHTLLRIDVAPEAGREDILGWAVDFTARTADDTVIVYMAKGIAGRYPASFGVRPYYQQLKRYSDWENRDIWEYRLDVTEDQLEFLIMHLWELRDVEFPYYFFTKNCSYELLRLLEISIPTLDVSEHIRGPVIPVDTVRAVTERPGLVKATSYRPSPATRLRAQLRALSPRERVRVRAIVGGRSQPEGELPADLPAQHRIRILDAAYAQLRYAYLAGDISEADSRSLARRILIARSRLGRGAAPAVAPVTIDVPAVRPDQGHGSSSVAIAAGYRDDEAFVDLSLRPAFHTLMDDGAGHLEGMQVRVLDTRLRIYPESGRVRLQELTVIDVASLSPRSRVFQPWAWRVATGLRTRRVPDHGDLEDASVWGSRVAFGLAHDLHPALLVYGLGEARLDVGPALDDAVSLGPGARLGAFAGGRDAPWRGHLFGEVTRFALGDTTTSLRGGGEFRLSTSRNTALGLECSVNHSYGETWLDVRFSARLHF